VLVLMCSLILLRCGALCLSNTVRIGLLHRAFYTVCDRQLFCGALFETACSHCACFVCVDNVLAGTFKLTGQQALHFVLMEDLDLSFHEDVPALYKSGNAK